MVVNLSALAVGQLLLSTGEARSFELFALVAILFALSLLPTALVRVRTPVPHEPTGLGAGELLRRTPTGVVGCFAVGVVGGAFWGLAPVMVTELGHDEDRVALFMFAAILGGMLLQFPIGRGSDVHDRRKVITLTAAFATLGPFLAGLVMGAVGPVGLFAWFAVVFAAFALFAAFRPTRTRPMPAAEQSEFAPIFATSQEAVELVDGEPPASAEIAPDSG